jgi:hypothetical protein
MNVEMIKRKQLSQATRLACWAICVAPVESAADSRHPFCEREFVRGAKGDSAADGSGRWNARRVCSAGGQERSNRRKWDVAVGGGSWQGQWQLEAVGGSPVAVHGSPSKLAFPLFSGLKRENRGKLTKTLPRTATNCHLDVNVLGFGLGGRDVLGSVGFKK